MGSKLNKAFRTVKIKASEFADGETLSQLEELYMILEAKKTDANEAFRKAQVAAAEMQIAQADRMQAEIKLIATAAQLNNTIARERNWLVFKDSDSNGALTFEGVTERLLRNNFRAQQSQMGKQLDDGDFGTMFEQSDEEDDE